MSDAIWFFAQLECRHCGRLCAEDAGRLYSDGLNPGFGDEARRLGESFSAGEENLRDAYVALRAPSPDERVRVIERWECPNCGRIQWARIALVREGPTWYRFLGAESVDLSPEVLADAHYLSRRLDFDLLDIPAGELQVLKDMIPATD